MVVPELVRIALGFRNIVPGGNVVSSRHIAKAAERLCVDRRPDRVGSDRDRDQSERHDGGATEPPQRRAGSFGSIDWIHFGSCCVPSVYSAPWWKEGGIV